MKVYLTDQSRNFVKYLEFLKEQPVMLYDKAGLVEKITERCLACLVSHSVEVGQIVGNNGQCLRGSLQSGKWNRKIWHGLRLLLFGSCWNWNLNSKWMLLASSDGFESTR